MFVKQMVQKSQGTEEPSPKRKVGTIHVDYIPGGKQKKSGKKEDDDDGEYVDYEVVN